MSDNVIQNSFTAGELAPSIYARTDLAAYRQGLAVCRNFFVDYRSGISTRNGTKFIIQCYKSAAAIRLVGFSVTTAVTYIIEFGDKYCRFINNGASVLESAFTISAATNGSPATITVPGNPWSAGDWIFITGIVGMPAMNGRFCLITSNSGGVVTLADVNGNPINSNSFGAYSSGGTASRVYTIPSPYAAADLALLKFVQSVSVLYITHPNYAPTTLSFFAPTNWVFNSIVFGTTLAAPTGAALSINIAHTTDTWVTYYSYLVTAVDGNGQESLPSAAANGSSTGNIATSPGTVTVTWNPVPGAVSYNIYKAEVSYTTTGYPSPGAMYGFVGFTNGNGNTTFVDTNIAQDFAVTPAVTNNLPFANGNNPSCVSFFQQRAFYASPLSALASFWASQPGNFNNFNESNPIQPGDLISGTIVSSLLNQIKHMLPMPGGLIFLTGRGAFTLSTGQGANATQAVTPENATITPQAYNGSSDIPPIVVNEDILYIQAKGSIVRDLSYNIYAAIYTGTDISIKSNHLFFNHTILYWSYAEEPFKVVWCVRDDGILLSLTFVKEQQIGGWARHDTQGLFQCVASIQEGTVDATYFVVQRLLPNGQFVQWIERQMERTFTYDAEDAWSVDAGNGNRNSLLTPGAALTISGSTGAVTINASTTVFSPSSVGQVVRAGGGLITITGFTSTTQVTGTVTRAITQIIPNTTIPAPFASGTWSIATPNNKFFGFDYLAGQPINVVADGSVFRNLLVAADGSITLPNGVTATKVVGGLGFQAQAQTMPLDTGEPTVQGKRKRIGPLNLKLSNTRGLKAGRTFSTVVPLKDQLISLPMNTPIPLITGEDRVIPDSLWDVPGQICFQVDDPMPVTILGVIPEIVIGDTSK